jgi:hypothetical protein
MYGKDDAAFVEHMETADTIQAESRVIAEWNMNIPGNIKEVGNYRNRANAPWDNLPAQWTEGDIYTDGATDADTTILFFNLAWPARPNHCLRLAPLFSIF